METNTNTNTNTNTMKNYTEKTEALTGFFYDEPSKVVDLIVCGKADREGRQEAYLEDQPSMDWNFWEYTRLGKIDLSEFFIIKSY